MHARFILLFGYGAAIAACGSPGSFDGKVAGKSLQVHSAAFSQGTASLQGGSDPNSASGFPSAVFLVGDADDVCADANAQALRRNKSYLVMALLNITSSNPVGAGSYVATDPHAGTLPSDPLAQGPAFVSIWLGDSACHNTLTDSQSSAGSGNVHLDTLDAKRASGTFRLTVGQQNDQVSGSFDAKPCASLQAFVRQLATGGTSPPCR